MDSEMLNRQQSDSTVSSSASTTESQSLTSKMTPTDIKSMMRNTMRQIEERKRQLATQIAAKSTATTSSSSDNGVTFFQPKSEKPPSATTATTTSSSISALQARISARLQSLGSIDGKTGATTRVPVMRPPGPLILDASGRTVDAVSGEVIHMARAAPELKANLRTTHSTSSTQSGTSSVIRSVTTSNHVGGAVKSALDSSEQKETKILPNKIAMATTEPPSASSSHSSSSFLDSRIALKSAARSKRMLNFNEKGKFVREADRLRMKAKLASLQSEISSIARRTGIASATELAKLGHISGDGSTGSKLNVDQQQSESVSQYKESYVEWWDAIIMESTAEESKESTAPTYTQYQLREKAISHLIEHPVQVEPFERDQASIALPVFLTKRETKKVRRQNRREAWKDKQDKIRLGLLKPDEPKVKMSNLMRVLGSEAVQDPTKVEAHVRKQIAKRAADHVKANADRKLTAEERRSKRARKTAEDTTYSVHIAVYCIRSLAHPGKRFKVETNARQLDMSGCVAMLSTSKSFSSLSSSASSSSSALAAQVNVVVVEGGVNQQKKFKRLMLHRIKWAEELTNPKLSSNVDDLSGALQLSRPNECHLVWEGEAKERAFGSPGEIKTKLFQSSDQARDFFEKANVTHYWDMCYSAALIEATSDTTSK